MQFAVCRFADLPHPRAWKVGGAVLKSEWCWEWWKQWGSNLRCSSFQILNRCRSIKYITKNILHSSVSVAQWIRRWTPNGGLLGSIPVWGGIFFQLVQLWRSIKYICKDILHPPVSVAQWLCRGTPNDGCPGSIPVQGGIFFQLGQWWRSINIYICEDIHLPPVQIAQWKHCQLRTDGSLVQTQGLSLVQIKSQNAGICSSSHCA